jgi:hypothetical protein
MPEGAQQDRFTAIVAKARFIGQVRPGYDHTDPLRQGQRQLYLMPGGTLYNRLPDSTFRQTLMGKELTLEGTLPAPPSRGRFDGRDCLISGWIILSDTTVLAALPLQWVPVRSTAEHRVAGVASAVPIADVVKMIQEIRGGNRKQAAKLDALYTEARRFVETPLTHETQMRRANAIAARISPGMTRREVGLVFPQQDGGLVSPFTGRYYLGAEVMADVPFSKQDGVSKPVNEVTGPVRLYRSAMHYD